MCQLFLYSVLLLVGCFIHTSTEYDSPGSTVPPTLGAKEANSPAAMKTAVTSDSVRLADPGRVLDSPPNKDQGALEALSKNVGSIRSAIIDILLILLIIAFLAASLWEMRRKLVVIELIDVPDDISKKGYSSGVIAQRIVAEITSLRRAARIRGRVEEGLEIGVTQLDFTVPTAGISYRNSIRYARQLFRRPEERVSGEIVREGDALRMVLRSRQGRTTSASLCVANDAEIPKLLEKAALELAMLVDPILVATYWLWAEQKQGEFEMTLDAINKCIANTKVSEHHRAYIIWGNCLALQRKFSEAEQKYEMAARLSPKSASIYNSWGNMLRMQRRFDEASAKYEESIGLDVKNPYPWNNLGNVHNDRHFFNAAVLRFERSIILDQQYSSPWSGLGYALWRLGRLPEAEEKFRRAVDLDAANTWAYIGWARVAMTQRRFEDAIAKLNAALPVTTQATAQIYGLWGDISLNMGQLSEAEAMYDQASKADPKAANGLVGKASLSFRRRKYAEVIERCREALQIDYYYIPAWLLWAESLRLSDQKIAAVQKYQELLQIDPYYAAAHVGIGLTCVSRYQFRNATSHFKCAVELDPTEAWAWRAWGDALMQLHRYKAARRKFRKATKVNPFDVYAWVRMGSTFLTSSDSIQAHACFAKACLLDGRNNFARGRLADALIDSDRMEEALSELKRAATAWPNEAKLLTEWGNALARLERFDEALTKYDKALSIDPADSDTLIRRGSILGALHRHEGALAVLRKVLRAEPWNDRARAALGKHLDELGQGAKALRWYSYCSRLAPRSVLLLIEWSQVIHRQIRMNKVLSDEQRASEYQKAVAKLRFAARLNPFDAAPIRNEGFYLLEMKQIKQALAKFKQALRVDRLDWQSWKGMGDALQEVKEHTRATEAYRRALALHYDRRTKLSLSKSLQQLGRHDEARCELHRILEIHPGDLNAQQMLTKLTTVGASG